jgi:hypothetical protein
MPDLSNTFDHCDFVSHSSDPIQIVAQCTNNMHEISRNFVWNDKFVMCKYHYCTILTQMAGDRHNTISCSGAMLSWGSEPDGGTIYNPITNQDLTWGSMHALPDGSVEWPLSGMDFYYFKDARMTFPEDVVNVNCTDDFKTCYEFDSGASECIGNIDGQFIMDSVFSFVIGLNIALAVAAIIYFGMGRYVRRLGQYTVMTIYFFPLAALTLMIRAFIIFNMGAYIAGNLLIIYLFPTIYLAVSSSRGAEKRRRLYTRFKN